MSEAGTRDRAGQNAKLSRIVPFWHSRRRDRTGQMPKGIVLSVPPCASLAVPLGPEGNKPAVPSRRAENSHSSSAARQAACFPGGPSVSIALGI